MKAEAKERNARDLVSDAIAESIASGLLRQTARTRCVSLNPDDEEEFRDMYFELLSRCDDDCDMFVRHTGTGKSQNEEVIYFDAWREDLSGGVEWHVYLYGDPKWTVDPDGCPPFHEL